MMSEEYYIVYKSILPEYYEWVINAKAMVEDEGYSVSDACKKFGISRSTYYKYKDKVFNASKSYGKKCIIGIRAGDRKGVCNNILTEIYDSSANLVSINSTLPIKGMAYITITIDLSDATVETSEILQRIKAIDYVKSANIIAIE